MKAATIFSFLLNVMRLLFVLPLQAEEEVYSKGEYYYSRGEYYEEKKEWEKAYLNFQLSALSGSVDGKNMLAYCYATGMGVARNYRESFELFRETAEAGNEEGAFNLAVAYELGHGTKRDMEKAFHWYKLSAEKDDSSAMYELAHCYLAGTGTSKNFDQTLFWIKKAVAANNPDAVNFLGSYFQGKGDDKKAFSLFQKAAKEGNADAQYNLGICYYEGKGTQKSLASAIEWLNKSAEQENISALMKLAELYANGIGGEKNKSQAARLRQKANELRLLEEQRPEDFNDFFDSVSTELKTGNYEKSFRQFRWFYREWGAYNSWLDEWTRWEKLFENNQEAKVFLEKAVEKLETEILAGDYSSKNINGVLKINRFLKRDDNTITFYKKFLKSSPEKAKRYWTADYLLLFMEKNEYEVAAKLTDPFREFNLQKRIYQRLTALKIGDSNISKSKAYFEKVTAALVTLLRKYGKIQEAEKMEQELSSVLDIKKK